MQFPASYVQSQDSPYRPNENERKVIYFLRDFFKKIAVNVVSGVYYYLFNKTVSHSTDTNQFGQSIQISNYGANSPTLTLLKTGGTETAGTAVSAGTLGFIQTTGYNGTNYYVGTTIKFVADENYSVGAAGSHIEFFTTPTGTVAIQQSGYIAPSGSWASGMPSLATNASTGFLYVPTCGGTPTGTPESIPGRSALVVDATNKKAYIYAGGAWNALN